MTSPTRVSRAELDGGNVSKVLVPIGELDLLDVEELVGLLRDAPKTERREWLRSLLETSALLAMKRAEAVA